MRNLFSIKRKTNKSLSELGKNKFKFTFYSEKVIYKNLCCLHLTSKEKKELSKQQKFDKYVDWKKYIVLKYKNTDKETLIEFSRHLNQRIRNRENSLDYWRLLIPVVLTISVTYIITRMMPITDGMNGGLWDIITLLLVIILFCIFIMFSIWSTLGEIWESNTEKNFLSDYKEIIDELISDK